MKISFTIATGLLMSAASFHAFAANSPPWVDSKEYKTLLDPNQFKQAPADAANQLLTALKQRLQQLDFDKSLDGSFSADGQDTVRYYDSPDSCVLHNQGYSLRLRQGDHDDLAFKFSHGDEELSAAQSVAGNGQNATEKLETDVTPSSLVYSHSGEQDASAAPDSIQALLKQFPGASALNAADSTPLRVVNDLEINQQEYSGPSSSLGQSKAKFTLTLWYLDGQPAPALAELSFRIKADKSAYYTRPVLTRAQTLFQAIKSINGWSQPKAGSKTAWVYAYQSAAYPGGFCRAESN